MTDQDARPRIDADQVREAARGRWPDIHAALGIPGRHLQNRHGPCPGCGGRDRFRYDDADGRGTWICSGKGNRQAGDGFDLLQHVHGWPFPETLQRVADHLGVETIDRQSQRSQPAPKAKPATAAEEKPRKRQALAPEYRERWAKARAITAEDTAGRYLASRGCALPSPEGDLRWHPRVTHWQCGHSGPALIALVTDFSRPEPVTLHFTWLARDGSGKADLGYYGTRLTLPGHTNIGVVRLWPDDDVTLGLLVGEGIEDVLTAAQGFTPVWATLNSGNLAKFPDLPGIESLTILADHDRAGIDAANRCAARWYEAGAEVRMWTAPEPGADANDTLGGSHVA